MPVEMWTSGRCTRAQHTFCISQCWFDGEPTLINGGFSERFPRADVVSQTEREYSRANRVAVLLELAVLLDVELEELAVLAVRVAVGVVRVRVLRVVLLLRQQLLGAALRLAPSVAPRSSRA